jgi:hypothetical protein
MTTCGWNGLASHKAHGWCIEGTLAGGYLLGLNLLDGGIFHGSWLGHQFIMVMMSSFGEHGTIHWDEWDETWDYKKTNPIPQIAHYHNQNNNKKRPK